jgi:hypothetical protein
MPSPIRAVWQGAFNKIMAKRAGVALDASETERAQILRKALPAGKAIESLRFDADLEETELQKLLNDTRSGADSTWMETLQHFRYSLSFPGSPAYKVMENNPQIRDIVASLKTSHYESLEPIPEQIQGSLRERLSSIAESALSKAESRTDMLYWAYRGRYDEQEALCRRSHCRPDPGPGTTPRQAIAIKCIAKSPLFDMT